MAVVRSRAPVRVSFAGGGTDVSPYPEEKGGCVVSATINKYSFTSLAQVPGKSHTFSSPENPEIKVDSLEGISLDGNYDLAKTVLLEMRPKTGTKLFFRNDVPPRSGLGSSAAGFVSLIAAFNSALSKNLSRQEIASLAYDIERNRLNVKGGKQDQYASAYGGLNFISFEGKKVKVKPLNLAASTLSELEKSLVMVFTAPRKEHGSDIISDQSKNYGQKKASAVRAFDSAKEIALEMKSALKKSDLERFGNLLDKGWSEKKKYSRLISTPFIDLLYEKAKSAGAIGGKITGAGGGGYMVFYCYPDKEILVRQALESVGCLSVPFSFESKGVTTWNPK